MPNLKILVAEDNLIHSNKMEMLLDEMGYDLIGIFASSEELLRAFHATKPDLILLDIELEGNKDGVEIAEKINTIRATPIIFTTALEDKSSIERATKTNPYAYLIKPIEKGALQAAMELALFKFSKEQNPQKVDETYNGWQEDLVMSNSFFIKAGGKLEKVQHDDILWIELAEERYCDIVTSNKNYHLRTSMTVLSQKLNPSHYLRIHRKYIVNIQKIDGIDEADLMLEIGEHSIPFGNTYKSALLSKLSLL